MYDNRLQKVNQNKRKYKRVIFQKIYNGPISKTNIKYVYQYFIF